MTFRPSFYASILTLSPYFDCVLALVGGVIFSCYAQDKPTTNQSPKGNTTKASQSAIPQFYGLQPDISQQISQYIRRIFQDKAGNVWFGTQGDGMSRYNGKSFSNFNEKNGLFNKHVQSIFEDKNGHLLLGTSGGAFRFDGKVFFNITKKTVVQL